MQKTIWILLLIVGCGGSAPLRTSPSKNLPSSRTGPQFVRPQKGGDEVLPGKLRLVRVGLQMDGRLTRAALQIRNISGQRLDGVYRVRYFDAEGRERRTSRSMAWKKFDIGANQIHTVEERYPSNDIDRVALEFRKG